MAMRESAAGHTMDEIRSALQKVLVSRDLPNYPIGNVHARLMAALWRMAAEDFLELHPTAWDEAQLEEPTPIGTLYMALIMEVHAWEKHGCRAVDFVFPTFFGAKLTAYYENENGDMVPEDELEEGAQ